MLYIHELHFLRLLKQIVYEYLVCYSTPIHFVARLRSVPPYGQFNECVFGINTATDVCGTIQVGDPVYAIKTPAA